MELDPVDVNRSFITDTLYQIRMNKSRRKRWSGHVAPTGDKECIQGFDMKVRREETTRKTGSCGRKILKWILEKWNGFVRTTHIDSSVSQSQFRSHPMLGNG
jgi:hypothetical protein